GGEGELCGGTVAGRRRDGLVAGVTLRLQPVESAWMRVDTEPVSGLAAMMDGLRDAAHDWPYTVGWIDCLADGASLGRGLLMRGRHAARWEAPAHAPSEPRRIAVPLDPPEFLLSPVLMRLFNSAYYRAHTRRRRAVAIVPYQGFFYPLDAVAGWNRLYGPRGFLQYQCVVPRAAGAGAVAALLERLAAPGAGSIFALLQGCGPRAQPH